MNEVPFNAGRALTFLVMCLCFCRPILAHILPPVLRIDRLSQVTVEVGGPADSGVSQFAVEELKRYASLMLGGAPRWQVVERKWSDGAYRIRLRIKPTRTVSAPAQHELFPAPKPHTDAFITDVTPEGVSVTGSDARSLLYGVYDLLDHQGCRWLFPGKNGEIVPSRRFLSFPVGIQRTRADLQMRGLFPVENLQRYTVRDVRNTLDWMAKNRLNYFVVIVNYGWSRLRNAILSEAGKRGIHVVGYLWSFELFLPLKLGNKHPEYFPLIDGRRRIEYNVKRCASSPGAIRTYVRNGRKWFQQHRRINEWVVIPNDGYGWCQCSRCRLLKPKDQWASFFVPLWQKVRKDNKSIRFENFIYVQRYDLPTNIDPYRDPRMGHFFDAFPRDKWFTLREPSPLRGVNPEGVVDPQARALSMNNYLSNRLKAWRSVARGRIWIFEDVMLHATWSIPVPNLNIVAADIEAARRERINGYLFEAYLQGWNSFASDLWSLARLCWDTQLDPSRLQREFYENLLGEQADKVLLFYDDFQSNYFERARACGSLYWMRCVPAAPGEYIRAVRSLNDSSIGPPGRYWHAQQMRVAYVMKQILKREAASHGSGLLSGLGPTDILAVCSALLKTGRAMDGVFLAYESLRQLFIREFGGGAMNFSPSLPPCFSDPEVRGLFAHQKLWDTLAEWEAAGKFPADPNDPNRLLRQILGRAIGEAIAYFSKEPAVQRR